MMGGNEARRGWGCGEVGVLGSGNKGEGRGGEGYRIVGLS